MIEAEAFEPADLEILNDNIGVGGEMEYEIASGHGLDQCRQIEVVAFDEPVPRGFQRIRDERTLAGGEIVPAHDGLAIGEEPVNEAAADKAGGAGDEDFFHVTDRWD